MKQIETCPIEILTENLAGIVYQYGKNFFKELESGDVKSQMNVDIVNVTGRFDQNTQNLH
jgi:hypothetical protein